MDVEHSEATRKVAAVIGAYVAEQGSIKPVIPATQRHGIARGLTIVASIPLALVIPLGPMLMVAMLAPMVSKLFVEPWIAELFPTPAVRIGRRCAALGIDLVGLWAEGSPEAEDYKRAKAKQFQRLVAARQASR